MKSQPADDSKATTPVAHERRLAVRYACELETTCRPLAQLKSDPWPTRVLDVSTTGIGICMVRRYEPGVILSIDLETPDGAIARNVILRVMNVSPTGDGSWRMGCKIAGELGDDELRAFRVERLRPSDPDLRAWVRFASDLETPCRELGAADSEGWQTRVVNISPGGLSLSAPRSFDHGALLSVDLPSAGATPKAQVVRVLRNENLGPQTWILGCEFANLLTEDEIQRLQ